MSDAYAEQSDGDLAARTIAGEEAAFAELVSRHKQPLHRLVARIIGDDDEALDLVQEAFVSAHGALRSFDRSRPMRAWLSRIAINKARDWRRRRAVRRLTSLVLPIDFGMNTADTTSSAETRAADRQQLENVTAAIAVLPARLRETLVLRTIEGLSQSEAAEVLGISEKAVETRLYRARRSLSRDFGEQR